MLDSFGMPHPHGTCVLLEFDSTRNLTEYFKQLYRPGVIFEVKGVKVNYVCNDASTMRMTMQVLARICLIVVVIVTQKQITYQQ